MNDYVWEPDTADEWRFRQDGLEYKFEVRYDKNGIALVAKDQLETLLRKNDCYKYEENVNVT